MPRAQRDLFFASWIWLWLVGQTSQVIHAGIQCQRNSFALLKGHISLSSLNFRVVALVDSGQHLHLNLCKASLFSQFQQLRHSITHKKYVNLTY